MKGTYCSGCFPKVNLQPSHGPYDGDNGLYRVAVDNYSILFAFFLRIAILMNDSWKRRKPQIITMDLRWKDPVNFHAL